MRYPWSIPDDDIPLSVAMLAKGYFGKDKIIAGECSAPAVISLNVSCNNEQIKKDLELDMNSNILFISAEWLISHFLNSAYIVLSAKCSNESFPVASFKKKFAPAVKLVWEILPPDASVIPLPINDVWDEQPCVNIARINKIIILNN